MTLARRMTLKLTALALSVTLLGAAIVWGLQAARQSARIARDEYLELRMILDVDEELVASRGMIAAGIDAQQARSRLDAANRRLAEFRDFQTQQHRDIGPHEEEEDGYRVVLQQELEHAIGLLGVADDPNGPTPEARNVVASLDRAQTQVRKLAVEMDEAISAAHRTSNTVLNTTLLVLAGISAVTLIVTFSISIAQYRSVVRPLRQLRDGVRRIASGQFSERIQVVRDDEFGNVARDFNEMASQLDELYRDLEQKVREKSRELARSERLASVGYLAAGVSHEINNPLNIISGYAELTLSRVRKRIAQATDGETEKALCIIRDESFRCKEIIEKLLSLATGGDKPCEQIALAHVVDDVATMLGSLKQYRNRTVTVQCDRSETLDVWGNETELRQVLLNLTINALEAVEPEVGEVRIEGRRRNGKVELAVCDNGRGMTAATAEHAFEPFYTERGGNGGRGVGLGLSITSAIVESHGGRITAQSDGRYRGSRFVIELPAYTTSQDP